MYPVILIGGFGRSGTGAIHQLLRAHNQIYTLPNYEFRLLTDPDGLISLKSAVVDNWNVFQVDFALDRFIKLYSNLGKNLPGPYVRSNFKKHFDVSFFKAINEFLMDLCIIEYRGLWAGKSTLIQKVILKITHQNKRLIGNPKIRYCKNYNESEFYTVSQRFIQNMHQKCMKMNNNSIILLNEPNSTQSPEYCMNLSGAKKMIVVYRDPRDSFASFRTKDWTPNKIKDAIAFFKSVYARWFKEREKINGKKILEIKLERLVKKPEFEIDRLSKFLGMDLNIELLNKSKFSPNNAHVGRWKKEFTNSEKNQINSEFSEILNYYNYKD